MPAADRQWTEKLEEVRMDVKRILVPVDFSAESREGVAVAAALAKQLGASLEVLTVMDVGDIRAAIRAQLHGFHTDSEVHAAVERWIEDQFATIDVPDAVTWQRKIRRGIVNAELMHEIREFDPQLIVMGSSGLMKRIPMGSTTEYVIRNCAVPVVVVNTVRVS